MSDHLESKDWRELSEAASREQDPQKLMELIRALNRVLEERERKLREGNQVTARSIALQVFPTREDEWAA